MPNNDSPAHSQERRLALFEDRYGAGSFRHLLARLEQPCVTFAQIAQQYGVSRERVRQWHLTFLPDAPRGHQRQRLCLIQQEKRKLLADPLFRAFYRHARPHFGSGDIALIRAQAGFRRRALRLNGRIVAIKSARAISGGKRSAARSYALTNSVGPVDFIYYRLTDADYLVVSSTLIPHGGTTFVDLDTSRYRNFRNTFAAVHDRANQPSSGPQPHPGWREHPDCASMQ